MKQNFGKPNLISANEIDYRQTERNFGKQNRLSANQIKFRQIKHCDKCESEITFKLIIADEKSTVVQVVRLCKSCWMKVMNALEGVVPVAEFFKEGVSL